MNLKEGAQSSERTLSSPYNGQLVLTPLVESIRGVQSWQRHRGTARLSRGLAGTKEVILHHVPASASASASRSTLNAPSDLLSCKIIDIWSANRALLCVAVSFGFPLASSASTRHH